MVPIETLKTLPQWIRSLGPTGAVTIFVVYMGAQTLPTIVKELILIRVELQRMNEQQQEIINGQRESVRLQRCLEFSSTGQERRRCFDKSF